MNTVIVYLKLKFKWVPFLSGSVVGGKPERAST